MQFVCLWYCVPPDFVVQINNFFILVLFSEVSEKVLRKTIKTIKYKLDSFSKTQFAVFLRRCHVLYVIKTQCVQILACDPPFTKPMNMDILVVHQINSF